MGEKLDMSQGYKLEKNLDVKDIGGRWRVISQWSEKVKTARKKGQYMPRAWHMIPRIAAAGTAGERSFGSYFRV